MASILIVDDQPYFRKLVSKSLTSEGYQVATIDDASLIWKYIRKFQLDLLLLNSLSEGFDSFELLMDIKSEYPKFPVLVYVIKSLKAIDSLKEAIIGVMNENRLPKRIGNLNPFNMEMTLPTRRRSCLASNLNFTVCKKA